jgi:diguanylate cyclase (GGDEF)-like protein
MGRSAAAHRRATVLVGTSDASIEQEARNAFEGGGFAVTTAATDAAVLAAFARDRPSLVLLAFEHMDADGFSLCGELDRMHRDDPVPIIVFVDALDGNAIASAFRAGAADVAVRPVKWTLLVQRAPRLLQMTNSVSELRRTRASLESVQRIAGVGSWVWDVETQRMQWSDQMFVILGFEPGGVKTDFEHFALCMHPEDRDVAIDVLKEAVTAVRSFAVPLRVVLGSGSVRYVQLQGEVSAEEVFQVRGTMQDVTEQRRAQEKIRNLAHYDSLTGLANRHRFMEQLERARQSARSNGYAMGLLYMDLDQFKRINDTLGHTAGDGLLRAVGDVLVDKVRPTDLVLCGRPADESEISRLGGDEFAVLLTEISSQEDAGRVASRILDALSTSIPVEGHKIVTTASIGIAVYPDHGEDVETLVKHADRAMYHAKEQGRNNYQYFSKALNEGALKRLTIESHLRAAIEAEAMHLHYQPRVEIATSRITGAEALVRWNHPSLGAVPPKDFIPLAEETGLIVPLGDWILRTACAKRRAWLDTGHDDIRVSVNVSTVQFRDPDLIATVSRALADAGLDPSQMELEITESLVLQDDEATATILSELRAMGLRIALDDFGTGYSSLSYLARFPLDILKLDRSFVRDVTMNSSARGIAAAVISMAHVLGLRVVAEGVDQEEQVRFLKEQGCDEIQGFLVSGALDPDEFLRFRAAYEGSSSPDRSS